MHHKQLKKEPFTPLQECSFSGKREDFAVGHQELGFGKVGALILAGGQGSRLSGRLPKALFPVSNIKEKTLLQLFCEKTRAASHKAGRPLKLALMTAPHNHDEIESYLKQNQFFGIENQLSLFRQEMLPLLDLQGNPFVEENGAVAQGPDGNGGCLKAFFQSGIWEEWHKAGIEVVTIVPIDNPLADPFDSNLVGFHRNHSLEVAVKAVLREKEEEKVGLLVEREGKIEVIEYTEFPEEKKREKEESGSFVYKLANTSQFCFSMSFIKRAAAAKLPLHFCKKLKEGKEILKCETFIFDLLLLAEKVKVIVYPREESYSPLKNSSGEHSLETVKQALLHLDRKRFHQITGKKVQNALFELDQAFHYPTEELLKRWRGKELPDLSYIAELD